MRTKLTALLAMGLVAVLGCQGQWKLGQDGGLESAKTSPDDWNAPLEAEPKILPETYVAAGKLAESRGDLVLAASMYRKSIALSPAYAEGYNRLGLMLTKLGYYKQAEEALQAAVELGGDQAYFRNNLAYCYIVQNRWVEAEALLREALKIQPEFARARVNLGMVLARMEQYPEAMAMFRSVLPEAGAHYNLGLIYELNQRYHEARACFAQALTLNPRMTTARAALERIAAQFRAQQQPEEGPADTSSEDRTEVAEATDDVEAAETPEAAVVPEILTEAEEASTVVPDPREETVSPVAPEEPAPEIQEEGPVAPPLTMPPMEEEDQEDSSLVGPPIPPGLLSALEEAKARAQEPAVKPAAPEQSTTGASAIEQELEQSKSEPTYDPLSDAKAVLAEIVAEVALLAPGSAVDADANGSDLASAFVPVLWEGHTGTDGVD
jgi:tetratricopeptide (TPR) repeat protein